MSLADRIDALRQQHRMRQTATRGPSHRQALHEGGRYARWQVDTSVESDSDGWLLSYLDLITLLLAMLVVLLGLSQLPGRESAGAPVELVGSLAPAASADGNNHRQIEVLFPVPDLPDLPDLQHTLADWVQPASLSTPVTELPSDLANAGPTVTSALQMHDATDASTTSVDAPSAAAPPPEPTMPSIADLGLDDLGDDVDVIVNEKTISFRISNELLFPSGQAMLSPTGLRLIARMAGVINRSDGHTVSVEGHSDPIPIQTRQFPSNWELSASRATSVLRELVRGGVQATRLRAVGYADTRPIASNGTSAGRAANRRVELIMEITPRSAVAKLQPPSGQ